MCPVTARLVNKTNRQVTGLFLVNWASQGHQLIEDGSISVTPLAQPSEETAIQQYGSQSQKKKGNNGFVSIVSKQYKRECFFFALGTKSE